MFGEDAIERQLADTRAMLGSAARPAEGEQAEPIMVGGGIGQGGKETMELTLGTDGRVERFHMRYSALHLGSDVLGEEIKRMVNAALDARAEQVGTDEPVPDLDAINESVAEIQDRSLRQFQAMTAQISDVMAKLNGRG